MISVLKRRSCLGLIAVLLVVLAGCGSSSKTSSTKTSSSSTGSGQASASTGASKKTFTVGIDIPFHPIFDYVEAKEADYFKGKPYTVKFKVLDATTQVPTFGRGDLDVMTTPPSFIPRVQQQYGINSAEFFPMARWTIGPQILVPTNSPYHTLADLKGKKVVMPPLTSRFGAEEAAILAATGQKITDYFSLQQTDAAPQQLALGRADAGFLEAPTTYPLLQSGKFRAIYSVHDAFLRAFGDPAVLNGGYIARTSFIRQNPQFIRDLIAATQDAWNRYNQDANAVNTVASKVSGVPVAQLAVVGRVLDLNGIPASQRQITAKDVQTWSKIYPLLAQSGFLKQAPADPKAMFVVSGTG